MNVVLRIVIIVSCAAGEAGAQDTRIQPPKRRAVVSQPAPLSELPVDADRIAPQTVRLVRRVQSAQGSVQTQGETIARTVQRVHVSAGRREWLFERNVRDPRRVSGTLIDHHARALIFHDESDLRNMLGMNGWADALKLGFDPGSHIESTHPEVDLTVLADPRLRFPSYKVVDLAEWLEGQ